MKLFLVREGKGNSMTDFSVTAKTTFTEVCRCACSCSSCYPGKQKPSTFLIWFINTKMFQPQQNPITWGAAQARGPFEGKGREEAFPFCSEEIEVQRDWDPDRNVGVCPLEGKPNPSSTWVWFFQTIHTPQLTLSVSSNLNLPYMKTQGGKHFTIPF